MVFAIASTAALVDRSISVKFSVSFIDGVTSGSSGSTGCWVGTGSISPTTPCNGGGRDAWTLSGSGSLRRIFVGTTIRDPRDVPIMIGVALDCEWTGS